MITGSRLAVLLAGFLIIFEATSLKFVTVDTAPYDGIKRFLWSANVSGIEVDVLQRSENDESDLSVVSKFIRKAELQDVDDVLYCDSKFLSVAGTASEILERWKSTGIDVLTDLSVHEGHLNLKCILGESGRILKIFEKLEDIIGIYELSDKGESIIEKLSAEVDFKVGQDSGSRVFLNVDKYPNMVGYTEDHLKFYNFETRDTPPILVGSPSSYNIFTRLTNYVPGVFDLEKITNRVKRKLYVRTGSEYKPYSFFAPDYAPNTPHAIYDHFKILDDAGKTEVMVTALLIKDDTPLLEICLDRFQSLVWLSKKRVVIILNRLKHREHVINEYMEGWRGKSRQMAVVVYNSSSPEVQSDRAMYDTVFKTCREYNCSWIWQQDSNILAIHTEVIRRLVLFNVSFIAPLIVSDINDKDPSVNFWGDTVANGFYKRSPDFKDLSQQQTSGLFVVPYVSGAFLMKAEGMKDVSYHNASYNDRDGDVVFCNSIRQSGHLFFINTDSEDMVFINGLTNETVPYPLLEHFPKNKVAFHLGFYMKWDHHRQRDYSYAHATPVQNPCDDVYVMQLFSDKFTRTLGRAVSHSDKWGSRTWREGWDVLETLSFQDMGYEEGWEYFSKDYLPTVAHRKFAGYESAGQPLHAFVMRMRNSSAATEALEGNGVYTVLVSISDGDGNSDLFFNDQCKVSPKAGDMIIFPSRLTNRVRFVPPKSGQILNIVSFYR
jgi:hypothetical protein